MSMDQTYTYVSTGITVPNGMSARMRFTGTITATPNPACRTPGSAFEMYVGGNPFGWAGNLQGARVGWFIGPVVGQGGEFLTGWELFENFGADSAAAVWSPDVQGSNGEIIFRRDPFGSGCESGSTPPYAWIAAYSLSGSQQVQVEFVTVDVGATKTTIQAGEPVTFTAYPINFVPATEIPGLWVFHAEATLGAPIYVEACTGQSTCTFTPPSRGRMEAAMQISGGWVSGFSATISIIPCPTGDALLDAGLTEELERTLQKSLADPNKLEFKSAVFRDRTTGVLRFEELVSIENDPKGCWVRTAAPRSTATEDLVATYHAHPHYNGEVLVCTDPVTKLVRPPGKVDYSSWGGGGPADWQTAFALSALEGRLIPTYVQDFNRIHRLNPVSLDPRTWPANAQHWPRCTTPIGG